MGGINQPDSQYDVITTVTHVLRAFEDMVRTEMPNCRCIYDEELSYESALRAIYAQDNYENNAGNDPLPALAYNRTVLKDAETPPGRRMKNNLGCIKIGTAPNQQIVTYSATHAEFEIQFLYITKSIEMQEKFEVVYNSNDGISGTREIQVDMGELGSFTYYLTFDDLIQKDIIHEDVYYKGIIGSIKARGFYFTFKATNEIIKQINASIYVSRELNEKTELVASIEILPS